MKFSVLLPTLNRLEYLRYAVETVRRQDYSDWEIVISDNCSEDDIEGFVRELDDPRIRYLRTDSLVPVTDNWNNALDHSSGDYVVMLGDDDGLMPGYFSTVEQALENFPDPDFIYGSALFYAYPGVIPDQPHGFLRKDRNRVFTETEPFWLDHERACQIARDYLDFRMPVASNMQFSLISRRKIDEFRSNGPFFRSPYPDFYATPALFLTSNRILVYPDPLVVIGITPKSYGYFHFNDRAADGLEFLHNSAALSEGGRTNPTMLPGTSYNDSWLLANEALRASFAEQRGMLPNYRRYRLLQIIHSYKKRYYEGRLSAEALKPLQQRMRPGERIAAAALATAFSLLALLPRNLFSAIEIPLRRMLGQHTFQPEEYGPGPSSNLVEVYQALDVRSTDVAAQASAYAEA
jgi:glycosyltransferase involved in cell wall biosynthesis